MADDSVYASGDGLVDALGGTIELGGVLHEGPQFVGEGELHAAVLVLDALHALRETDRLPTFLNLLHLLGRDCKEVIK